MLILPPKTSLFEGIFDIHLLIDFGIPFLIRVEWLELTFTDIGLSSGFLYREYFFSDIVKYLFSFIHFLCLKGF